MSTQNQNKITLLFATLNDGKYREVSAVAEDYGLQVISPQMLVADPSAFGLQQPPSAPIPNVEESGETYIANARLKAEAFQAWGGLPTFADDSGLEVDALEGAPGLYSSRFAGLQQDSQDNMQKLLEELQGASNRSARFRCVLCCKLQRDSELIIEDLLEGEIGLERSGGGGFGYDPVFVVQGGDQTLAQLKERDELSPTHRTKACHKLFEKLT